MTLKAPSLPIQKHAPNTSTKFSMTETDRITTPKGRLKLRIRTQWQLFPLVLLTLLVFCASGLVALPAAQAQMATGSYTGNGLDNQSKTVGFQPDVVIIKASDRNEEAVCRTSSMTGDNTKPMGANGALTAGLIKSLDANGFFSNLLFLYPGEGCITASARYH